MLASPPSLQVLSAIGEPANTQITGRPRVPGNNGYSEIGSGFLR